MLRFGQEVSISDAMVVLQGNAKRNDIHERQREETELGNVVAALAQPDQRSRVDCSPERSRVLARS